MTFATIHTQCTQTHKTLEFAELQVAGSSSKGIIASTLAEVRFFAQAGYADITYSVPVCQQKLAAIAAVEGAAVTVFVDCEQQVRGVMCVRMIICIPPYVLMCV